MKNFNLVKDPWIKVFKDGEKEVSLSEFFKHAHEFEILAGDSRQQDLSTLRFLLAIVQRVYSDKKYLLSRKSFDDKIQAYLSEHIDEFNLTGNKPFYQVTKEIYNQFVTGNFKIKDGRKISGEVKTKMLNRNISESSNSPNIFVSMSERDKNKLNTPALVRWLIAYQNFTGTTDKSKADLGHFIRVSPGYLYRIAPVYVQGNNLYETLVLNFAEESASQKPVWEWDILDYINQIETPPDNLSQLYTLLSRLVYIDWSEGKPKLYMTGLPLAEDITGDPMKIEDSYLNLSNYHGFMELNFDKVLNAPVVKDLDRYNLTDVKLCSTNYISDGRATTQTPAFNYHEEIQVDLSRSDDIIQATEITQDVINYYRILWKNIESIRGTKSGKSQKMVESMQGKLSILLKDFIESAEDLDIYKTRLRRYMYKQIEEVVHPTISSHDLKLIREDTPTTVLEAISIFEKTITKICN
ncbi:MAG: type I-E CRISPR-associated protein Cse1/CasA [Ligilactobacillus salivarius]|nr:type I-E CRISPR-associated protein Cse1/CasA [Ligilactobacillus salivarius]MDY5247845.1 type I-E CRISPR-associated protein Cse1/CasA [Ligilactobacillus salivarius]